MVVREHGELRARLNPWNSESSCASMTPKNPWIVTSGMLHVSVGGKLTGVRPSNDVFESVFVNNQLEWSLKPFPGRLEHDATHTRFKYFRPIVNQ